MVRPFDHHDRLYQFKVYAPTITERFGAVYIPSRWSWQPHEIPLVK
jgi:hypothetical protein